MSVRVHERRGGLDAAVQVERRPPRPRRRSPAPNAARACPGARLGRAEHDHVGEAQARRPRPDRLAPDTSATLMRVRPPSSRSWNAVERRGRHDGAQDAVAQELQALVGVLDRLALGGGRVRDGREQQLLGSRSGSRGSPAAAWSSLRLLVPRCSVHGIARALRSACRRSDGLVGHGRSLCADARFATGLRDCLEKRRVAHRSRGRGQHAVLHRRGRSRSRAPPAARPSRPEAARRRSVSGLTCVHEPLQACP